MILVSYNMYLRRKMRQMHITNTSNPSKTVAPTTPATTAAVKTPVASSGVAVASWVAVALGVVVKWGLVVDGLVVTLWQRVSSVAPVLKWQKISYEWHIKTYSTDEYAHCEGTHGYRHDHQVYSLAVQFAGSGGTAKSVRQSVSLECWRMAKCEVIHLTLIVTLVVISSKRRKPK